MTTPRPLIPRWYAASAIAMLSALTLGFAVLCALVEPGAPRVAAIALCAFAALLWVAALSALGRRRRPRAPRVAPDGTVVFTAPAATVWPLLGAWGAVLVVAGMWAWMAVADFSSIELPGATVVCVLGALGSLPDLVRLLTGRLHRWRVEVGPETLTYRGYRTERTWPWSKLHGAAIQERGPAGVRIDVKGAGADPVIPAAAFAEPAEQIVEAIRAAKAAAGGRR